MIKQASGNFTYETEPGSTLVCDLDKKTIEAPAEGGDAVVWLTFARDITVRSFPEWTKVSITPEDGFYKLSISVDPSETAREGKLVCLYGNLSQEYTIKQAGKTAGE